MSKQNLKKIIILILIFLILLLTYFNFFKKNKVDVTENTPTEEQGSNFVYDFFKNILSNNKDKKDNALETNNLVIELENNGSITEIPYTLPKLRKVSGFEISGYGFNETEVFEDVPLEEEFLYIEDGQEGTITTKPTPPKIETISKIKYVEKSSGNIYQNLLDKEDERRFSETIIPNTKEVFFLDNSYSVIMRYGDEVKRIITSFLGSTPKTLLGGDSLESGKITGSFLAENILDISISPNQKNFFYINKINDYVIGIVSSETGINKNQIFESSFTEWLSFWPKNDLITLTTKPSYFFPGIMYSLNPNNKDFKKILDNVYGLTTLTSPNGKNVLFSNSNMSLSIFNTETKTTKNLNTRTLSDKCVWSSDNINIYCFVPKNPLLIKQYPDIWYQGEVVFEDDVFKINTLNQNKEKLVNTEDFDNLKIDGVDLKLDKTENFLLFINKTEPFLWSLKIN